MPTDETAQSADDSERDELPRVECSCGWTWDVLDAVEDGEMSAYRVKKRFGSMSEGHAYFNREPGHDLQYVRKDEITDEMVRSLRTDADRSGGVR